MPLDMLDRLCLDPGMRTLGELMQERELAVGEIRRLRRDVGRLSRKSDAVRIEKEMSQEAVDVKAPRSGAECAATDSACGSGNYARDRSLHDL